MLDEGHVIKNGASKTSQAVKSLKARHRLILSGTPLQVFISAIYLGDSSERFISKVHLSDIYIGNSSRRFATAIRHGDAISAMISAIISAMMLPVARPISAMILAIMIHDTPAAPHAHRNRTTGAIAAHPSQSASPQPQGSMPG